MAMVMRYWKSDEKSGGLSLVVCRLWCLTIMVGMLDCLVEMRDDFERRRALLYRRAARVNSIRYD